MCVCQIVTVNLRSNAESRRSSDDQLQVTNGSAEALLIKLHREAFADLMHRVAVGLASGRANDAARVAAVAADYASRQHPGFHAEPDFETLLAEIGRTLDKPDRVAAEDSVVHVCSRSMGAPSAATRRRLDEATPHRPHLFFTDQEDPLGSARRLREVAHGAAAVMVHVEPHDIVPAMAFGGWDGRPPVVHVNHHETVFWAGVGIADLVVSHQASGGALAVERRFVSPGRVGQLPSQEASDDAWVEWTAGMFELLARIHRAWLPAAMLPGPVDQRDLDVARRLRSAGRSDGLRGSWHRHGEAVDSPIRPDLTVIVVGSDFVDTLECIHGVLDVPNSFDEVQLIVVDTGSDPDFANSMADMAGVVTVVPYEPGSTVGELVGAAAKWCAADLTAVVSDSVQVTRSTWQQALRRVRQLERPVALGPQIGDAGVVQFIAGSWQVDGWLDLIAGDIGFDRLIGTVPR